MPIVIAVLAVVLIFLLLRAAQAPSPTRPAKQPRVRRPQTMVAPDDNPEFLRELDRQARRQHGEETG